ANASIFSNEPIKTLAATFMAWMATVPFVVVITTRRPLIFSNSSGELPRSKPSRGKPSRSPARSRSESFNLSLRASSTVLTGIIASAPEARPVIIEEVARKTSKTTAVTPLKSVAEVLRISLGQRATWIIPFFGTSNASGETSTVVRNPHKCQNNSPKTTLTPVAALWIAPRSRLRSEPALSKRRSVLRLTVRTQITRHSWRSFLLLRVAHKELRASLQQTNYGAPQDQFLPMRPFWPSLKDSVPGIQVCTQEVLPTELLQAVQGADRKKLQIHHVAIAGQSVSG